MSLPRISEEILKQLNIRKAITVIPKNSRISRSTCTILLSRCPKMASDKSPVPTQDANARQSRKVTFRVAQTFRKPTANRRSAVRGSNLKGRLFSSLLSVLYTDISTSRE